MQTMYSAAQQLNIVNSEYLEYHRDEECDNHVNTSDINFKWQGIHSPFSFRVKFCEENDFNGCAVNIQYHAL